MRYRAAAASNIGKIRTGNEDNFLFEGRFLPEIHESLSEPEKGEFSGHETGLFAVFDGMGGHASGERASYLAAKTASGLSKSGEADAPLKMLSRICEEAYGIITADDRGEGRKMGTTAAMLHLQDDRFSLCNIGDSPIYLLREGKLETLSVEHTEKSSYEKIFRQKAEPGRKFALTQCLGGGMEDILIEPHFLEGEVQGGDVFLLCSDGLSDMLSEDMLREILLGADSPEQAVRKLEKAALEQGGKDNITVICIQAQQEDLGPEKTQGSLLSSFAFVAFVIAMGFACGWLLTSSPLRLPIF